MAIHGLQAPESIIELDAEQRFWEAIVTYTDRQNDRNIRRDLRASIESIRHKLNVIRYNASLIQTLSEDEYFEFVSPLFRNNSLISQVQFQDLCTYKMKDQYEYRLVLTALVENLSAAAFSLLDVCAHLLKDLFSLPFLANNNRPINVSFKKALEESALQGYTDLYNFLSKYRATPPNMTPSSNLVDWIDPLEQVRHRMTHRPITDILRSDNDGNLFFPNDNKFLVNEQFFTTNQAENLKTFAERCYEGLEEFVIELYEKLIVEVNNAQTVPI